MALRSLSKMVSFLPSAARSSQKLLRRCASDSSNTTTTLAKPHLNQKEYSVTFIRSDGEKVKGKGKEGDSLLDVVVNNDLDFDGFGACEGTLTCSTCHVVLKQEDFDKLPDKPSEEECDMLDLAYGLTDTSRLGCQILLSKEIDGLEVQLPQTVNDARES